MPVVSTHIPTPDPPPPWLRPDAPAIPVDREFSPMPGERKALRRKKPMRPSAWAERYRVLTPKVSRLHGRWRNDATPYLVGIMDAAALPFIREINICKSPQVGVTEAIHNFVGYAIDRDPGPVMYVFPDEEMSRENMKDRIEPMISGTPHLRRYMTGSCYDSQSLRLDLRHVNLYVGWARSASRLGNKPIRYLALDEVDKYTDTAGKREASPVKLAKDRLTTFANVSKCFMYSTPTYAAGNICTAISNECEIVFSFEVRCPLCGHRQQMKFGGIKWDGGSKADFKSVSAWYECEKCAGRWDDELRNQAVRAGVWRDKATGRQLLYALRKDRPRAIGFLVPAWLSRFVSLSKCAAAFLEAKQRKKPISWRYFYNSIMAEPYVEHEQDREEDHILALKDARPAGEVPGGGVVACLVAGIDTQDDGFWYEIRAVGYGYVADTWQVRFGFVPANWSAVPQDLLVGRPWPYHPAFDALRRILWEDVYRDHNGEEYRVMFAGIDAMGHRTKEVYDFCRANPGRIAPIQGMRSRGNTPHKWSRIDKYPGTNRPIPGGVNLLQLDVNHYKDELAATLRIRPMDPGAWHMCVEVTDAWAAQMCTEYLDEKTNRWSCPDGADNHAWDVSTYATAIMDVMGVKHWRKPEPDKQPAPATPKRTENPFTGGVPVFGGR